MNYFFLYAYVLLVQGVYNGALYDLKRGKIFSISSTVKKILTRTETGLSLEDFGNSALVVRDFLQQLESLELGYFCDECIPHEKINIKPPKQKLTMMWLALNTNCNLMCNHCYATSEPGPSDGKLALEYVFHAIAEARKEFDLQCVQLIGGEPLLLGKGRVTAIIEETHRIGIPFIEIFSNGHLIDDYYIQLFKEKKVQVAISIYSDASKEHDLVTNHVGSWEKTVNSIKKLRAAEIPLRFGVVAMNTNRDSVKRVVPWLEREFNIPVNGKPFDVVRSCGRGCNSNIIPWDLFQEQHIRNKPDFLPVSLQSVQTAMYGNVCWVDKICILPNGDVTPCEMEFANVQGNITKQSLSEIILGPGGDIAQRLTKDKVKTCCDCEYRYACWECRPMAHQLDTKSFSKPLTCMYNPYAGIWETSPEELIQRFPKLLTVI